MTLHDPNRPPDAQDLYAAMRESVRALLAPQTHLVGITSGGAWLAGIYGAGDVLIVLGTTAQLRTLNALAGNAP